MTCDLTYGIRCCVLVKLTSAASWQGKVFQCDIKLLSIEAWKALQCKYYEHEGGVRRILVYSMAFPVSEIHRMQVQAGVMQARVKVGWGKSWNCATRKSPNHTAFYSFEATLCVENVSINMVIYMLYNTNAIYYMLIYMLITCNISYMLYNKYFCISPFPYYMVYTFSFCYMPVL